MRSFKISHVRQLVIVALLAVLVFLTLVPILFMLVSSLKSNAQILGNFGGFLHRPDGAITAKPSTAFGATSLTRSSMPSSEASS